MLWRGECLNLCFGEDKQQHKVRQVEEPVVQDRAPEAVGLAVEPALGEAEEEKGDERRVRPGLEEVVGGGEEDGGENRHELRDGWFCNQ